MNELISFALVPLLFFGGSIGYQTSFCNIEIVSINGTISCDSLKDTLYFEESQYITLELNSTSDTIKIINNYTIPTPTSSSLGGVFAQSCNGGFYVAGIDTNGSIICQALP